ncbi:kinase-like protein [Sporormia fimetaria CBS 119925]|uniref:non-specific serine/threonine protein kinase n=1 Tax=Sporormia fimetaria CBS 119925 TaxID=1340428 RepID=A0A6A6V3S8_9PLEO|nr:kinase-like protein [Sporormia fimetaria CBS 119925]
MPTQPTTKFKKYNPQLNPACPPIRTTRDPGWVFHTAFGSDKNVGALNGGICLVTDERPSPVVRKSVKLYMEKKFSADHVRSGIAQREIEAMYQVSDCWYIVQILDCYLDHERAVGGIVMEQCSMGSLDKQIERQRNKGRRIGEREVWGWLFTLSKALVVLHYGPNARDRKYRGDWNMLYHRDIKPANIFLHRETENPAVQKGTIVAKLGDLGAASSKFRLDNKIGGATLSWQSFLTFKQPEYPRYSDKSDIWTLGATFVCACRLERGYHGHEDPDLPAGEYYSSSLNGILRKCLEKDVEKRWTSYQLKTQLEERLYSEEWKKKMRWEDIEKVDLVKPVKLE